MQVRRPGAPYLCSAVLAGEVIRWICKRSSAERLARAGTTYVASIRAVRDQNGEPMEAAEPYHL